MRLFFFFCGTYNTIVFVYTMKVNRVKNYISLHSLTFIRTKTFVCVMTEVSFSLNYPFNTSLWKLWCKITINQRQFTALPTHYPALLNNFPLNMVIFALLQRESSALTLSQWISSTLCGIALSGQFAAV